MSKKKRIEPHLVGRVISDGKGRVGNIIWWSQQPDCVVSMNAVKERTRENWHILKAIHTPIPKNKRHQKWSTKEEAILRQMWNRPINEIVKKLGRSRSSINHKKQRMTNA